MMNSNAEKRERTSPYLVLAGIGLGAVYWIVEAAVKALVFHEGTVAASLLSPDPHELWTRLSAVAMLIAFSACAHVALTRRREAEELLQRSEARARATLQTAADGIITIDDRGTIESFNQQAERIFGYRADEVIGKSASILMPSPDRPQSARYIADYLSTGDSKIVGQGRQLVGQRKNGTACPIDVAVSETGAGGRRGFTAVVRDASQRKQDEELVRGERDFLARLLALTSSQLTDPEDFCDHMVNAMADRLDTSMACISIVDRDELRVVSSWDHGEIKHGLTIRLEVTPCRDLVRERRICSLRGPLQELFPDDACFQNRTLRCFAAAPIFRHTGDVMGVASVLSEEEREFTSDELTLLRLFGQIAGAFLERHEAESELKESQRALLTLMSNLPGMAYRCRNDRRWTMEFASEGCCELTGFRPEDLVNNRRVAYADLIHPDDQERVWQDVQAALRACKPFQLVYRITTASGQVHWVWEQGRGVFSADGELLALEGFVTDISEQKRAEAELARYRDHLEELVVTRTTELTAANESLHREIGERARADEALRQSEERLRAILNNTTAVVYLKDLHGKYMLINSQYERLFHITNDRIRGKTDLDIFPKEMAEAFQCNDRAVLEAGKPLELEEIAPHDDGPHTYISIKFPLSDAAGVPYGVCGISTDITDRKRAEEALRESEQRFRQLAESIHEVFWVTSSDYEQILYVSPAYEEIWGRPCESLYRERWSWAEAIHPEDRPRVIAALESGDRESFDQQYRILRPDGNVRWIHDRGFPVRNERDEVYRIAGVAEDITERQRAEEALRASEQKYRTLLENLPQRIFYKDTQSVYVSCNQNYARDCGIDPAEIAGKTDFDFYPRELAEKYRADDRKVVESGMTADLEEEYTCDGRESFVHTVKTPVKDERGRVVGILGIFWDITARKQAEQALRQARDDLEARVTERTAELRKTNETLEGEIAERRRAEEALRYRAEFEKLIAALSTNFINLAPEEIDGGINDALAQIGRFAAVDRAYIFQFSEDGKTMDNTHEWCGEGVEPQMSRLRGLDLEAFPWFSEGIRRRQVVYVPRVAELPADACAEKQEWESEDIRSLINVPMVYGGRAVGFVGFDSVRSEKRWSEDIIALLTIVGEIFVNALQRKRAEEERRRLSTAVEQAAEAIVITDIGGKIQYVNPAFEGITGYSRREVAGRHARLLRSRQHEGAFYRELWDTLVRGEVWTGRFISKRKNGALYEVETTISPIRDGSGAISNYVAVMHDVTHEVALETQLRQAQKMEAVGTLASGIAHDFNNLLTAMLGHLTLAANCLPREHEVARYLGHVEQAAGRCADLVRSLLTFARRLPSKRVPTDLSEVVSETIDLLEAALPEMIELDLRLQGGLPPVLADVGQMRQVVLNLCVNARDAMREGGTIVIETQAASWSGQGADEAGRADAAVRLSVTDTGCGMDADTRSRAFEPFFSTKNELGQGTGLGLSIVYGIVEQHGGRITIDSLPGEGTRVDIVFPAVSGAKPRLTTPGTIGRGARSAQPTGPVLFADDEQLVLHANASFLRSMGLEVVCVEDGEQALRAFREHPRRFSVLVLDHKMPRMSGLQCLQAIRQADRDIPALLTTGCVTGEISEACEELGAIELVEKPFRPADLFNRIARIVESGHRRRRRRSQRNQPPEQKADGAAE